MCSPVPSHHTHNPLIWPAAVAAVDLVEPVCVCDLVPSHSGRLDYRADLNYELKREPNYEFAASALRSTLERLAGLQHPERVLDHEVRLHSSARAGSATRRIVDATVPTLLDVFVNAAILYPAAAAAALPAAARPSRSCQCSPYGLPVCRTRQQATE